MHDTNLKDTLKEGIPLGQKSPYPTAYDKNLLFGVKRAAQRQAMNLGDNPGFVGFDVWNDYELFWLNHKGKPVRSYASFVVPAESPNLLESKSVKLYLNSLNHQSFNDPEEVRHLIAKDFSDMCEADVQVIMAPDELTHIVPPTQLKYLCLDHLDIAVHHYQRTPELLTADHNIVTEQKLVTHLFKSHCLCTGQPDFGSIFVDYVGPKIDEASMLAYLISYRDHVGFAENCIEQIFVDIKRACAPQKLTVFGRFTRRGGIDIDPYRSTHTIAFENTRLLYQ